LSKNISVGQYRVLIYLPKHKNAQKSYYEAH